MLTLGVGRYRSKIENSKARDAELETRYGQALMREALPKFSVSIKDWLVSIAKYATPARYQIRQWHIFLKFVGPGLFCVCQAGQLFQAS